MVHQSLPDLSKTYKHIKVAKDFVDKNSHTGW
jgi:hypothetical protein